MKRDEVLVEASSLPASWSEVFTRARPGAQSAFVSSAQYFIRTKLRTVLVLDSAVERF
jgi:hypothetical protein